MRYLIQTTEVYRADSEAEAQGVITEAKQADEYTLTKYSSEKKEVKAKGEVLFLSVVSLGSVGRILAPNFIVPLRLLE